MELSENAKSTLEKRYYRKDKNGKPIENWEELCKRVAYAIAEDEKEKDIPIFADSYFNIMYNLEFLPNTPTIINAGKKNGQLSACFVLDMEDDMGSILEALTDAAMIHKSGGGTGFNFSKLRPANSIVASSYGTASGPVSFMRMFNGVTEEIKQGGARRGANMAILRVDHPDIIDFINCKKDLSQLNNFNISVAVTNSFMEKVKQNKKYKLINPKDNKVVKEINAKEVFDLIVERAWESGEPGVFFIDTANKNEFYKKIHATNPCGEQPIPPNESCNLGSINVSRFCVNGKFDWKKYVNTVSVATRFLDSVISRNCYPTEAIKKASLETRRIGLGIMGLADLFCMMDIPYGSKDSFDLADKLYSVLWEEANNTSEKLGEEKGICEAMKNAKKPRRNLALTTIAPTGSISIIAGCSSGIEPLFMIGFERNILDGSKMLEMNKYFVDKMGDKFTPKIEKEVCSKMSIQDMKEIPKKIREVFVLASDLSPEKHILMQSKFQRYSDSGVSKTVNMSKDATKEDVAKVYLEAFKLGCKGVTVYRDGSRKNQPMSAIKETSRKKYNRTQTLYGTTERINTSLGKLYLTINRHSQGEPGEVIMNIGKSGADINAFCEGLGRLISTALQHGIPIHKIAHQLNGIKGEEHIIHNNKKYSSILDLVGRMITDQVSEEDNVACLSKCPYCGNRLYQAEGCISCVSCGYSRC